MEYVTFETERYGRKYRTQRIRCNNHDELVEYYRRYGFTSEEKSDIEYLEESGYPIYMEIIKEQWMLNRMISAKSCIDKDGGWTEIRSVPIRPIYKVVE